MEAFLVGVYDNKETQELTPFGQAVNSKSGGRLQKLLDIAGPVKSSKVRIFYDVSADYPLVVVVGLGAKDASFNPLEDFDENRENVRKAIAAGVSTIQKLDVKINSIQIDGTEEPEAAAEGATLGGYVFGELKDEKNREKQLPIQLAHVDTGDKVTRTSAWERGVLLGKYQNVCKRLMELPANILTPTKFAEEAQKLGAELGFQVIVRDRQWAEEKGMNSFLSVSNGSVQPPKFVELYYKNTKDEQRKPIVFVGKGITFDSGGISIKPSSKMDAMRADMGGAANVLSLVSALAAMKADVNIIGLIPLAENMPSGSATKPGDVVVAMNGKTIQINNTDAEGRLVLADGLTYADSFEPELVASIATLTGAIIIALGEAASGVYSTNEHYWNLIHKAGQHTGDRVWRMPLFSAYSRLIKDAQLADLDNITKNPSYGGGSCVAAAFLKEFTQAKNWMHLDIAGPMANSGDVSYLSKGMTGRPLRSLVKFIESAFKESSA